MNAQSRIYGSEVSSGEFLDEEQFFYQYAHLNPDEFKKMHRQYLLEQKARLETQLAALAEVCAQHQSNIAHYDEEIVKEKKKKQEALDRFDQEIQSLKDRRNALIAQDEKENDDSSDHDDAKRHAPQA